MCIPSQPWYIFEVLIARDLSLVCRRARSIGLIRIRRTYPFPNDTFNSAQLNPDESSDLIQLIWKIYGWVRMSLTPTGTAHSCLRKDVKEFTTPSSGSQLNDRATHLISSHLIRVVDGWVLLIRMSPIERTHSINMVYGIMLCPSVSISFFLPVHPFACSCCDAGWRLQDFTRDSLRADDHYTRALCAVSQVPAPSPPGPPGSVAPLSGLHMLASVVFDIVASACGVISPPSTVAFWTEEEALRFTQKRWGSELLSIYAHCMCRV